MNYTYHFPWRTFPIRNPTLNRALLFPSSFIKFAPFSRLTGLQVLQVNSVINNRAPFKVCNVFQCRWELRSDHHDEGYSPSHWQSGLETSGYLQVFLWNRRWVLPIRRTDMLHEVWFLDLRRLPGLYIAPLCVIVVCLTVSNLVSYFDVHRLCIISIGRVCLYHMIFTKDSSYFPSINMLMFVMVKRRVSIEGRGNILTVI